MDSGDNIIHNILTTEDCDAVTATEPNLKDTAEIFFDVIKIETSEEEQDGQMTAEQPNSGATKHAVFDVVKIEADDENQDSQTDQTKATPGETAGGMDKAVKENQGQKPGKPLSDHTFLSNTSVDKVGSKKEHRIERTCIICNEIINHMTLHLRRKHPDLSDQEKTEYRAEMRRQTPIRKSGIVRKKLKRSFECPLCRLPVQKVDGHLVNAHKLKRGTAKMKSLVSQARDRGPVTATEEPTSIDTQEIISDQVEKDTVEGKQDGQVDQTKESLRESTGGMDKPVTENEDNKPEKPPQSDHTSILLNTAVDKVGSKKVHRIERTCIICGEIINHMALHLRRKHCDLSDQEKIEYRAEMRRQTPIRKRRSGRKKLKSCLECPLCGLPVQKVDGHLVNAHKLKRGTAKMKSLVSKARDRGPVTATEEPTSRDTPEIISDQVEKDTVEGKQDDQVDQTKESLRESTGGMDKAVKENEDTKPEKPPQSEHTSLLNTSVDKGSKKAHRIKRTCIICGEIINHMALHLRRKHRDLSDQEKTEYRAEMLRQTPIRKAGIVRKNEKRSFECPLCRLPVQRIDGHLVNAHKLERGTAKMKSLVSQAKGSRKEHRINRTCIICGEIINHMALHLGRKHPDLSDKEKMEYRAKMLQQRPIRKRKVARKRLKSYLECPLCGLPVQKVDGHLVNAHKLKRGTVIMTSLVSQAKDRGPVSAAQQPKPRDAQEMISDQVEQHTDEGKQDDQMLMDRTKEFSESMRESIGGMDKAGEENQDKKLSSGKPPDSHTSILLNTSTDKEGAKKCHRIKRTCIICGEIINHMALHLRRKHPDLSDQEKMEYRAKMLRQTPIRKRRATRRKLKSCLECPLCGLPVQKVDGHLVNTHKLKRGTVMMTSLVSQAKDGAKKFHRIKRTCIICSKVIKNMAQHLQRKHYGLSDQEKIEYRAEMLRQTPIHQRGRTRENIKRSFECPLCGLPFQRIDQHLIKQHKLIRGTAKLKSFIYQAEEARHSASRTSKNSVDGQHVSVDEITEDDLHANPGLHATSHAVLEENSAILNNLSPGKRSCQKRMVRFPLREKLKHLCFVCGKLFNGKSNLASHMTVHSGERSHQCSICNKLFTNRYNLEKHARIHSGEKPYRCHECDGKFSTSSRLASHRMYHTGEKPHRCLLCDKAFSKQQDLKGHMEVHTGLKKFECVVCDKAFSREGFLKVHMRIHADEKSYQCSICKKAFTAKRYLEGHMVIHSG